MQRKGRCRGAPCGADELGDVSDPLFIQVVDGAVAQELTRQEQRGMCVRGSATGVRRRTSLVSNGVAVRPSHRTEGCSNNACCSYPAGTVVA